VNATPRPLYPRQRDVLETVWALGSVWTASETLARTGIRNPGPSTP